MPDTTKYLDIDGLTEYHESAGHSADIADGSITTAKLAPMAVTASKLADKAITATKLASKAVDSYSLANGAVTALKLADDAVYTNNISDGSVTIDKISNDAKQELASAILYATDATTAQTLTELGYAATVITPQGAYSTSPHMNIRSMLCWIDTASGYLERAPLDFSGNLQSQTITLWAKGLHSMASGILGVDTSWTIASN